MLVLCGIPTIVDFEFCTNLRSVILNWSQKYCLSVSLSLKSSIADIFHTSTFKCVFQLHLGLALVSFMKCENSRSNF